MGHITNADGSITVQSTPTQTVADMQAITDRSEDIGGLLKGTAAERASLTADQAKDGWLFSETDTGRLYQMRAGNWIRFAGYTSGTFNGATSSTGTATVSHGLGVTPSIVLVTNRHEGAVPLERTIAPGAKNQTQIQFVVGRNGSAFTNNPVVFDWVAYP